MTRVFLVDDHATIRCVYAEAVEAASDLTMCSTAASFAEALEALPAARPDVALIDISLGRGGPGGLELIRRLGASMGEARPRWLVVSAHDGAASVERAREAGADGFLSKREAGDALRAAVRSVAEGAGRFPF